MASKTLIPALKARVGDWDYYVCTMKYAEVARQVQFAYELGGNRDLSSMIQRGLSGRTEEILKYLLKSPHRFLGGLLVACTGGNPQYATLAMSDPEGMLEGIDQGFGVLTFDGTQQYFAIDGQHRLKAIKDAIKKDPSLADEDIAVLIVSTDLAAPVGRERIRRLFTNINRNAKTTTTAENIALDEDNGYSVITRRLLTEHDFLKEEGVVRVFTRVGDEGELALAQKSVNQTDKKALTTIVVLREMLESLWFTSDGPSLAERPTDDILEESYKILLGRIDQLLVACGEVRARLTAAASARDLRAPKNREHEGHAFMRPVIQLAVTEVAHQIVEQGNLTWDEVLQRLSELDWRIGKAPWTSVFNPQTGTMNTSKEFVNLLKELLYIHLAPQSMQAIRRARKAYKDMQRGPSYPISEDNLAQRLPTDGAVASAPVPVSLIPSTSGGTSASEDGSEASTAETVGV